MINVLLIIKRYRGPYALVNEMARLDERRFRCVVCYLSGERDGKNPLDDRIKTYYLGLKNNEISPWNSRARRALSDIFNNERIDVVNCHLQRTIGLTVAAARMARRPPRLLATLHGLGSADSWKRRFGNWFLYRGLDRVIGVSEAVRQDILRTNWGLKPDKVVTIHNGIDPAPFLKLHDKETLRQELFPDIHAKVWFGTAGRLSKVKNHFRLLEAFRHCLEGCSESVLLLCGYGDAERELKEHALSLGITERVRFLGFRRDIAQVLATLDVFTLPSLREGFGLALVEAMCSGVPVIASQVGGIPEILGETPTGELIDPENTESLAAAMIRMTKLSDAERKVLGEAARTRVLENFTAEKMIRQYELLYEEVCRTLLPHRD